MSRQAAFRQRCAQCGSAVRRAHRDPDTETRRAAAATGLRRYRCTADGCGWQGLLPRLSRTGANPGTGADGSHSLHALQRRWRHAAWPAAALAALAVAAVAVVWQGLAGPPAQPLVPAGESHYGRPLNDAHPLQVRFDTALAATQPGDPVPGLSLRQNCVWGRPGGNPYRGTVAQALQAAGLPPDVVADLAGQVQRAAPADRLTIATDGIHAARSGREFSPAGMAMTYGHTLCLGTRVNFAAGHTEPASLYEATDATGRLHSVMVPDVCGNVTMISQGTARRGRPKLTSGGGGSVPVTWLIDIPDPGSDFGPGLSHSVPEPGTLWGVATGLALLAWRGRRRVKAWWRPGSRSDPERP